MNCVVQGRLDSFISNVDASLASRLANVTDTNVQGEFLSLPLNAVIPVVTAMASIIARNPLLNLVMPSSVDRIGSQVFLDHGTPDLTLAADLHSQTLQQAFLLSAQKADAGKSLREVTFKFPDLIRMIFDEELFSYPTTPDETHENFIERLVRHQIGMTANGTQTAVIKDDMLTRFTKDIWKLAYDEGLTKRDGYDIKTGSYFRHDVSNTLIAFAMQMYYDSTANATNPNKQLFTAIAGGIQFDRNDVASSLTQAKGYSLYFAKYITANFTEAEQQIRAILPSLRDWYVQAGIRTRRAYSPCQGSTPYC